MYYLNCITAVIDYQDSTLTDFRNYTELSGEELVAVYALAKLFHPSIFINAGIFIVDQKLLFNHSNQFYEITDETIGFNDYFKSNGVTIIEWADMIEDKLPEER